MELLSSAAISEISADILQAAKEAGFEVAGIAPIEDSPELKYFPRWVAAGHAGEMKYLESRDEQGRLKRESLVNTVPWARSVVVCAINYNTAQPYSTHSSADAKERGWISRYAWGKTDYHDSVMRRLKQVEAVLKNSARGDGLITRCYVDTGPIVERVMAKYAGVGWIGKNTCIINQQVGSWLFLGVVLTSLELKAGLPAPDRCGSCRRCLDACPTGALIAPYQMDATKCISYLTIEHRGPIAPSLMEGMGRQVFGCDICQDVCPWNRKAVMSTDLELQTRPELVNPALEALAAMDESEFERKFNGSPVRRAGFLGLKRNVAIAVGNSGLSRFAPWLEQWAESEDEGLRSAARWALEKISGK